MENIESGRSPTAMQAREEHGRLFAHLGSLTTGEQGTLGTQE
jgi:hypothetical protein